MQVHAGLSTPVQTNPTPVETSRPLLPLQESSEYRHVRHMLLFSLKFLTRKEKGLSHAPLLTFSRLARRTILQRSAVVSGITLFSFCKAWHSALCSGHALSCVCRKEQSSHVHGDWVCPVGE